VIRTRLRRLVARVDARVARGEGAPDAQYRFDARAWNDLRNRVDAELRHQQIVSQGYTAGLTDAQIQAKIAADPAFVGAEQVANEAIRDLLREPTGEGAASSGATP
jgi:hypothetical protein